MFQENLFQRRSLFGIACEKIAGGLSMAACSFCQLLGVFFLLLLAPRGANITVTVLNTTSHHLIHVCRYVIRCNSLRSFFLAGYHRLSSRCQYLILLWRHCRPTGHTYNPTKIIMRFICQFNLISHAKHLSM